MINTTHITERFQDYQVKNPKTFKNSHARYLKTRRVLLLNGKHQHIEVISIMNQQFEKQNEEYIFTCDLQYKIINYGEEE